MFKKIGNLAVVLALVVSLLAGLSPGLLLAAGDITVVSSTATPQFPSSLTFSLQATAAANIVDVRLHYIVERESFVRVVTEQKPGFSSSRNITTVYTWDMRQSGGLPAGTVVYYWWTITDSAKNISNTSQQKVSFDDTRFSWRTLKGSNITLYWYSGNTAFAQTLLDKSLASLATLATNTGAQLNRPVAIYIYDNSTDMKGAMIFAQEWTGGATYPPYSTIVIGINSSNLEWGKGALVHELTHMVNYQMTNNPYSSMPTWLDEGLAMYSQGSLDSTFEVSLVSAIAQGRLFTVRSMASPFSTDAALSYQEYAQSYSLIEFLVSRYGQTKMAALLQAFQDGNTYDGAILQVYGFDMDGLNKLWLTYATQKYLSAKTGATA
jgi:hypothetical protein